MQIASLDLLMRHEILASTISILMKQGKWVTAANLDFSFWSQIMETSLKFCIVSLNL